MYTKHIYIIYFIITCLLILNGCINNEKHKEITHDEKLDFNSIMDSIKQNDFTKIFNNIVYIGPFRNEKLMAINYSDTTEVIFNFVGVEYFKIMRKGHEHQISDDEMKRTLKDTYNLLARLGIISLSYSNKYQKMEFVLDLERIKPETLPKYTIRENANRYNEGVLVYSYDGQFEASTVFKNFKPTKIASDWYFYIR